MPDPQDLIAKLKTARVRYLEAVVEYRRERDAAESKLRVAEHELSQGLAELFCLGEKDPLAATTATTATVTTTEAARVC